MVSNSPRTLQTRGSAQTQDDRSAPCRASPQGLAVACPWCPQASTRLLPLPSSLCRIQGMPLLQYPALGTAPGHEGLIPPMTHKRRVSPCSTSAPAPGRAQSSQQCSTKPPGCSMLRCPRWSPLTDPGAWPELPQHRQHFMAGWCKHSPGEGLRVLPAAPTPLGAGRALKWEGTRQNTGQPLMIIGLGYVNAEL